jgi:hypothetical protein
MSRLRGAIAATALLALAAAPTAIAHEGNPDFRSNITSVGPAAPGVHVQILNFDDRIELRNTSGRTITVQGYNGEPYARLLGDGTVELNRRSPAFYLNQDRTAEAKVPAFARAGAAPQWQVVDRAGRLQWHDHRIHWMGSGLPPQVKDKGARAKILDWSIPLRVGTSAATVRGTLSYQPRAGGGAPVGALAGLVALTALGAGAVVVVRRRRRVPAGTEDW